MHEVSEFDEKNDAYARTRRLAHAYALLPIAIRVEGYFRLRPVFILRSRKKPEMTSLFAGSNEIVSSLQNDRPRLNNFTIGGLGDRNCSIPPNVDIGFSFDRLYAFNAFNR
jgi:hypothetical protein